MSCFIFYREKPCEVSDAQHKKHAEEIDELTKRLTELANRKVPEKIVETIKETGTKTETKVYHHHHHIQPLHVHETRHIIPPPRPILERRVRINHSPPPPPPIHEHHVPPPRPEIFHSPPPTIQR